MREDHNSDDRRPRGGHRDRLFAGYANGDMETVRGLLAEDLSAYVTNAKAGVDEVSGADDTCSACPT